MTAHRPHCRACPWIPDWSIDGQPAGSPNIRYADRAIAERDSDIDLSAPFSLQRQRTASAIRPIAERTP